MNDENKSGLTDDEYNSLQEDIDQTSEESNQKYGFGGLPRRLAVSEAMRAKNGNYEVVGQIATVSTVYNMVTAISAICLNCNTENGKKFKEPLYAPPDMRNSKCISCSEKGFKITPEWISTVDIGLQDSEKFNDIERLSVKLFGNDTNDVGAGETVSVIGNIDVARKNEGHSGKYVNVLYADSIKYTRREKIELTDQDVKDILAWKDAMQESELVNTLVEMFEPTVVANDYVKKSLLLADVNAGIVNDLNRDPKRLRINVLLVGDPSLAKSVMLRKSSTLVQNGRYESAQGSTGLSLTFTTAKEGDAYVLRLGPIPLANGSLCAINEMNQMPLEQQKHFLDFMEEGWSTNNKYVIHAHITGNTSLVASANPRNVHWRHPETIELDEINVLTQIIHRFDIICVLRETIPNEEADRQYVAAINEIKRNNKNGVYSGYESFLKKYLMYARTFNPDAEISEDASNMLDEYWIKMSQRGTKGRYRKLEGIKRIAVAISKLKLKNEVDTEDATDAMQFYNVILMHFSQIAPVSQRPKELLYESCINIIRQHSPTSIASKELYRLASERNEQIQSYIGNDLNIETNRKLRVVYDELLNNEHVLLVKQKPAVFQWRSESQPQQNYNNSNEQEQGQTMVKADKQASDISDLYDTPRDVAASENNEEYKHEENSLNQNAVPQAAPTPSDMSDMSDRNSPYANLIETKYLPNLARTLYWCKEHPNTSEYYDLAGIEESHFKPIHG